LPYNAVVDFEFDPNKDAANIRKHGVSLRAGRVVLGNMVGEQQDPRPYGGEVRMRAFGRIQGRLFCCVYTVRGAARRIISVRVANRKEAREWLGDT
jgi:hypothetical protein